MFSICKAAKAPRPSRLPSAPMASLGHSDLIETENTKEHDGPSRLRASFQCLVTIAFDSFPKQQSLLASS